MEYELNTGGIKSPQDDRDLQLEIVARADFPETLPDSCFLDVSQLPVWMQNKIGACVGHAWGKSQQHVELQEDGKVYDLSARFLYAISKCLDGYPGEGTYPRLTAKVLQKYGCATEKTCPNNTLLDHETYVYNRKLENVPYEAMIEAGKFKISGYAFSSLTEDGIKKAIYYAKTKRQGVVMLKQVGDTYWKDVNGNSTWEAGKILPLRRPSSITSGHEVFPIGYEYINGRFVVHFLNSWSSAWADNGKGWFYFDEWKDLVTEVMTSLDKSNVPVQTFKKDLYLGMTDPDVLLLQKLLNKNGYTIATSGAGSPGKETNFFGNLTRLAVIKLQKDWNIKPQAGYFGPITRQVANTL